MSCEHEWDPYPDEVRDVPYSATLNPNVTGARIVPCNKCGAPIDRGHDSRVWFRVPEDSERSLA